MNKCNQCNDTGFLPFVKDGKIIPNARIHCECHSEPEHYIPISSEDIDFPCSYLWRAYYAETLEGVMLPDIEPQEEQMEERINDLKQTLDNIQPYPPYKKLLELQGRIIYCENKILELRVSKRKYNKYI